MIDDMDKIDLIKTFDHHTSSTKGLLSNSLMIKNIGQNRPLSQQLITTHQPQKDYY